MAIREPYEFPQDPATHPAGEMAISVADPITAGPPDSTFYLARRFDFSEGNYTFIVNADDGATVWIGTSQLNSRMIASGVIGTPITAYLNIPQDSYRVDVILQNMTAVESPCYFDMVIMRGDEVVYASSKAGWLLDDAPISDQDLPPGADYRFKLPVFSLLPNWQNGILERLTWQTNVLGSETDAEQRRSVRRNARRTFEVSFGPRPQWHKERNRLDTFFAGIGPAQFMMPLWHESVKMIDGLDMEASGVTFPDGELGLREFRTGDLVFVCDTDPDDYDILQVGEMETNRFSWAFPPPRSWPKGTRIYPMRVATTTTQVPKMSNITDEVSTATVLFDQYEPYTVPASWGASVSGSPLFHFRPHRAQTIDVDYNRLNYTLDNFSGVPATIDHGRFTTTQVSFQIRLFDRSRAYSFRQFLQAARGQSKHFYMPTFMNDVQIIGDVPPDTEQLMIEPQGYAKYMLRPQPLRLQLAFIFKDATPTVYRLITGVEEIYRTDSNPPIVIAELLTLDSPLPAIELKQLKRVSFIVETRFAQDSFEIYHRTNQQRAIETSLVFRQAQNPRVMP